MGNFVIVGINVALLFTGLVVGIYFLHKFSRTRGRIDPFTSNMFFAIGMGAVSGGLSRIYYIPIYFARGVEEAYIEDWVSQYKWVLLFLLVISAWSYILHLKPLFYWIRQRNWILLTAVTVTGLMGFGTLAAMVLSLYHQP